MSRFFKKVSEKSGLSPGSLVSIGDKKMEKVRMTILDYDEKSMSEKEIKTFDECLPFIKTPSITWINIDGLHDIDIIQRIGEIFNIHPLVLEDIVNTGQRPKYEDHENYLFIVLKMLQLEEKEEKIRTEQVSLILGPNFVISFQEEEGDVFNPVRERIKNYKGKIRKMGADYLAYALLDAIIDNYFVILEKFDEKIEIIEDELLDNPSPKTLQIIHNLKRETIFLRKSVWPLREVIASLERRESKLIKETTVPYLRDLYDHTIRVIEGVETVRDLISGVLDIYLSSVSNKMNNVMKVLTIIATIFIPLTFIAGIYGMNFRFMPELEWRWSYPSVWVLMIAVFVSMLLYFRRKGWI
ncbi:magnesium/cobalt transporter CorA [bacterium]|nr:magnesium/cobalt transporter CorA [bacterium]